MDRINPEGLRVFLTVARLGHLGRASEALHLDQSTVSRKIARLEDALGVLLFDRVGRSIRLTGDTEATQLVRDVCSRPRPKITDTMDGLWTVQEVVFDLMLPWRTELPEDVELIGSPLPPTWRFNAA